MENNFDKNNFNSINFISDIPDYEPKLPKVKYNEMSNQIKFE